MRAYTHERDADRRRHAVLDEDYWAYRGRAQLTTVCWRPAMHPAGEWEPEGGNNCPKCVKRLARLGLMEAWA